MARAKKSEVTLTLEEKLEQALVADWEQPYKVPENWCWTTLGMLCKFINGYAFKSNNFSDVTGVPVIRITNISDGHVDIENCIFTTETDIDEKFIVNNGDLLIAMSGATTGKNGVYKNDVKVFLNQRVGNIKVKYKNILKQEFRNYYISCIQETILDSAYGGAQPNISASKICQLLIPLPPFSEQQRIVDRIERMFLKLDEVKENVQNVIDGFENRKSAILHKAFTGELTAKWRKEKGLTFASWGNVVMDDVCVINPPKLNTKDLDDSLEVSFVPMASLSEIYGEIIAPQVRILKDVKSGFTSFKEGDVVFAKITPCMENGKCAIVGNLVNDIGYGTTEFYVFRCGEKLFNRYLYHILRHKSFRDRAKAEMTGAVGQQRVPKSFLQKYSLYLPSYDEQLEIVRILDKIIFKEQQAKEKAEEVLERIELIRKSILARAFRGELGTNNPEEASSLELLKSVLSEDKDEKRITKSKSIRVSIPAEIKAMLSNHFEKDILKLFYKAESNEVSIDDIMSLSSNKFEIMDALKALEEKKLISKKANGIYKLAR